MTSRKMVKLKGCLFQTDSDHTINCSFVAAKVYTKSVVVIPNGCLDAYEYKVNIDIFKYQEKVKLISQFQRFFSFFSGLLEVVSLP